jgi:signal transduction histidine kinase
MEERARKEDGLQELQHLAANTLELLDTSLSEVRRLVARLGPAILDEMGFVDALRRLCDGLEERTDADVFLETTDTMPSLSGPMETALYRMVQEALTNVARHAEATSVELRLSYEPDHERLSLGISDNGRGFDAQGNTQKKGRGLAGIQERAELLGGEMEVHASRGEGVTLHITIPMPASSGA